MSSYIGPITDSVIEGIIQEFRKRETKEKVMRNIIDPVLCDITARYYPYFMMLVVILLIIIVLLVAILIMTIMNREK